MLSSVTFELRPAAIGDASSIASVHLTTALFAYSEIFPAAASKPGLRDLIAFWSELLAVEAATVIVATNHMDIIGCIAIRPDLAVPTGVLLDKLYVAPDFWRQGIGDRRHTHALDEATAAGHDEINLWVMAKNLRARGFYERRGSGLRPGTALLHEQSGVVEVLYSRSLRQA